MRVAWIAPLFVLVILNASGTTVGGTTFGSATVGGTTGAAAAGELRAVSKLSQEDPEAFLQVTSGSATDYFPSWSPDGANIAFGSNRQADNIWVVPSKGGEPRQVSRDPEGSPSRHPSWSPDGLYIAHDAESGTRVRVVSAQDGSVVATIPDFVPISRGGYPCWSPHGSRIAFTAAGGIWTIEPSSGTLTQVYSREGYWARAFGWSPDGARIAIDLANPAMQERDIWIIALDGSAAVQLTDDPGEERNPHWSPDGATIAFMSDRSGNRDIWVIAAEGGNARQVTSHPGADRNPRWSPDGTKLAFASDRGGSLDIWIVDMEMQLAEAAPARQHRPSARASGPARRARPWSYGP